MSTGMEAITFTLIVKQNWNSANRGKLGRKDNLTEQQKKRDRKGRTKMSEINTSHKVRGKG